MVADRRLTRAVQRHRVNEVLPVEELPVGTTPDAVAANDMTVAVNVTGWPCNGLVGSADTPVALPAASTVWVNTPEVLFPNVFVSVETNCAVIAWAPPARVDTVNEPVPALNATGAPNDVVPSKNSTVPAGIPVAGDTGDTVALNVTALENTDGFNELDTAVDVKPPATTWVVASEVLVVKVVSPEYMAVIAWSPTVNVVVSSVATPPSAGAVPNEAAPSKNSTVPDGTPAAAPAAATVAVNVTD